ncbi:hypothetical protein MSAR_42370 [Mycolicibacterium sarraceniae]|uniref:DUF732 domain-containing protein n=2 Tax=Mycolicibacterium sarraceniae TaxID=1534348 RepID=A0A7I7SXS7_9MYCO|nr:hypothetical protein MSAR_42370 [Mycolicibacterium sarraceniae]
MALAAPAAADSDSVIKVLANDGWTGPAATAIAIGQHICSDIADGVEPKDAAFFYSAAATNLCRH